VSSSPFRFVIDPDSSVISEGLILRAATLIFVLL
jgi:hypothetical protein